MDDMADEFGDMLKVLYYIQIAVSSAHFNYFLGNTGENERKN